MRCSLAGLVILSNVLLFNLCLFAQEKTSSADINSYRGRVPEPLFTKISVDLKEVRFEQALKEIAEKGNFRLNYNRSRIPVEQRVTVKMDSVPALQALFKILGDTETGLKITREGLLAVVPSKKRIAGNEYRRNNSPSGIINGTVIDVETRAPLADAAVEVLGTKLGAITDRQGRFIISSVPVGTYVLRVSFTGYEPFLATDIVVKSAGYTTLNAKLKLLVIEIGSIVVEASYFTAAEEELTSTVAFSQEEIRRTSGTAGDVSRTINSLPSIANTDDEDNFLVVRGGHPAENGFYIDNMQITGINHFSHPASMGGAIGLLNVDFLQDVTFSAGGFSAEYGDRLSSVMELTYREGNRDKFCTEFGANMAGLSFQGEGPIAGGKGSWLLSLRRSYLDLLQKIVAPKEDEEDIIRFGDYQTKLTLDINDRNRINLLAVAGKSEEQNRSTFIVDNNGDEDENPLLYDQQTWSDKSEAWVSFVGLNWFNQWSNKGYSNTSISYCLNDFSEFDKNYAYNTTHSENSTDQAIQLRNVNFFRFNRYCRIKYGVEAKHIISDINGSHIDKKTLNADLLGSFASLELSPHRKFDTSLGLRYDYYSFNAGSHLSPRASVAWKLTDKTTLTAAAGIYHQTIPLNILSRQLWRENGEQPDKARDATAYHYILGYNYLLTKNTRLTVEVYDKEYRNFDLPIDIEETRLDISLLNSSRRAFCRGVEITVQKKLARDLYGLLSGTYFQSRFRDQSGAWKDRYFNNRYIISAQGGYVANKNWELSARFIYAGGRPYTPFDGTLNSAYYPAYHTLNLRVDRRFNFRHSNLVVYADIWNIYNQQNVDHYARTEDGKIREVSQWGLMPVGGLEWEF